MSLNKVQTPKPQVAPQQSPASEASRAANPALVSDAAINKHIGCACHRSGPPPPEPDAFGAGQKTAADQAAQNVALGSEAAPVPEGTAAAEPETRVIDVYFHVINQGKGVKNGNLSREHINAQIDVLNQAYAGSGFQFNLASVDRTTNKAWYTAEPGTQAEIKMKRALHQGDQGDLNIYSLSPSEGLLGWATFPDEYAARPKQDGVVILNKSLPIVGGDKYLGHTATHEVGHWLGLHHTFNQPGRPRNDGIKDTPAHEVNYGRPEEGTDTLPKKPGLDPIHNFMNYVDDAWMSEFTPGQIRHMQKQWDLHRDETPGVA